MAQAFVIFAAALWIYWPALNGGLIWDDAWYIKLSPQLQDWTGLWKFWFAPGSWVEYYPLNETLFWICYQLWGEQTLGYHLVSFALHIAGALLVWRLLGQFGLRYAWLGGLLFAIHPVQVQSAAWICELKNTFSLPFAILAMSAWIDFEKHQRARDYRLALLFFLLSMLSKITMAPFAFVILLYAWWLRGRIQLADLKRATPFFVLAVALAALTLYSSSVYNLHNHGEPEVIPMGDIATRLARAGVLFWFYLASCLFPVDMTPIYPKWNITADTVAVWLPLLALFVLGIWCWIKRATWGRHMILGLGFFGMNLLPFLGLNFVSYMTDIWVELHLLYLPVVGIIGLFVAMIGDLERKLPRAWRFVPIGAAAVALIAMICGARAYAGWFKDAEVFWSRAIQRSPNSPLPYLDLGSYMIDAKRYPEALAYLRQSVALQPDYDLGYYNMGIALEKLGEDDEAKTQYLKAIQINPDGSGAYLSLGEMLRQQGAVDQAEQTFRDGLKHAPDADKLAVDLAGILLAKGQVNDALQLYKQAEETSPDSAPVQYDYGTALLKAGSLSEAEEHFAQAVALNPRLAAAHQSHGAVLAQLGRLPEAIDEFQAALEIDPTLSSARNNLARALVQSGRIPEAIEQLQQVMRYHPDDAQAQQNLSRLQQYEQQHAPPVGP